MPSTLACPPTFGHEIGTAEVNGGRAAAMTIVHRLGGAGIDIDPEDGHVLILGVLIHLRRGFVLAGRWRLLGMWSGTRVHRGSGVILG